MYRLTENGRKLIQHYEGKYNKAYLCPAGIWTIGIGHTLNVKEGDIATEEQIERFFYDDIVKFEGQINDLHLKITQNQFDALVSFIFNLGIGNFKSSTLYKKIKVYSNDPEIRYQFSRWNKGMVNGSLVELPGLTKRRASEAEMYFTGKLLLI